MVTASAPVLPVISAWIFRLPSWYLNFPSPMSTNSSCQRQLCSLRYHLKYWSLTLTSPLRVYTSNAHHALPRASFYLLRESSPTAQTDWRMGHKTLPLGYIWLEGRRPQIRAEPIRDSQEFGMKPTGYGIVSCECPWAVLPSQLWNGLCWPEAPSIGRTRSEEREKDAAVPGAHGTLWKNIVSCCVASSCLWIMENFSPVLLCFKEACWTGFLLPAKNTLIKTISKKDFLKPSGGAHKFTGKIV